MISAYAEYGPWMVPSLLSKDSSIIARPAGLRVLLPLKITSSIVSERSCFMLDSPSTQRTASMMFDLPQPLGPTIEVRFEGKGSDDGSTKDLKPANLIEDSRMEPVRVAKTICPHPMPGEGSF